MFYKVERLQIRLMTRINIEIDDELHKQAKLNAIIQNKTLIKYLHESLELKINMDAKKKQ
jgi:predicted HicB family RNase H-like nuclease